MTKIVEKFGLFLGAKQFYAEADLQNGNQPVLSACPAGIERSRRFNSVMPKAGINVPKINDEGRYSEESPLNTNPPHEGLPLVQVILILLDEQTTVSEEGIKSRFFDKPIKRLSLIVQLENLVDVNSIGRALNVLKKKNGIEGKLPITVDIVVEEDVQRFYDKTAEFVKTHEK